VIYHIQNSSLGVSCKYNNLKNKGYKNMGAERYVLDDKDNLLFRPLERLSNIANSVGPLAIAIAGGIKTTIEELSRGEIHIFQADDTAQL
jgi:hypothetical protein